MFLLITQKIQCSETHKFIFFVDKLKVNAHQNYYVVQHNFAFHFCLAPVTLVCVCARVCTHVCAYMCACVLGATVSDG